MRRFVSIVCAVCILCLCTGSLANAENVHSITGIVIDAAMHTIYIEATDGERYYFHKEGDEDTSRLTGGIQIGGALTLTYEGDIGEGGDTSNTTLLAIADGALRATIDMVVMAEGEPEHNTLTLYVSDAGFATYYEADTFNVVKNEFGADVFSPSYTEALDGIRLYGESLGDVTVDRAIAEASNTLSNNGVTPEEKDMGALFASYAARGVMGVAGGMYYEAVAVRVGARTYLFRVSYPIDAGDGYGAQLHAILNRVEFVDAQGKASCALYIPNENVDGFIKTPAMAAYSVQGLMNALYEYGALPEPALVLGASIDSGVMTLDLARGYAKSAASTGTAGEQMLIGCVVNTMIENFGVRAVRLLSCGGIIETGHAIYDEPLGFIE